MIWRVGCKELAVVCWWWPVRQVAPLRSSAKRIRSAGKMSCRRPPASWKATGVDEDEPRASVEVGVQKTQGPLVGVLGCVIAQHMPFPGVKTLFAKEVF